jgi:small neutral amino acid transporter SnatA (MarC family)
VPGSARATPARRIGLAAATWLLVALLLRLAVVAPERCPIVDAATLRASAGEAVAWFERNQHDDGTWLYRYDAETDTDLGDYNVVRHAGVTMSLYQAAAEGHDGAGEVADRGAAWALDNLVAHDDWLAFEPDAGIVSTGATGLLVAGLAERRAATGEGRHDAELAAMGRFLDQMVEPGGAVAARWDPSTGRPVPGEYSPFFTGEIYWALALLHREFPVDGWDDPARRIARYLATERDDEEGWFPDISDHWAAYGMAVQAADWPRREGVQSPLDDAQVAYAERQAGMAGIQVRWESQRTDTWPNWWLRGRRTLGAGLGTLGEQLTGLWQVAGADERLADLEAPLTERARCVAGILVDRQVSPEEAAASADPDRSRGAWFQFGVTQMDDQQHALSAVLRTEPIVLAQPVQTERPWGEGAVPALLVAALVLAVNPFRAAVGARRVWAADPGGRRQPLVTAAVGVTLAVAGLGALAWISGPLLDLLDSSAPTARIAAGLVLVVSAAAEVVRRPPDEPVAGPGWRAGVVPLAVPLLVRPAAAVVALSAGADRGVLLVIAGAAVAGLMAAAAGAATAGPHRGATAAAVLRWAAVVASAGALLVGVALAVDGVFDV